MDPTNDITAADLALDDEGEDLWDQLLPHLPAALSGDPAPFLDALEAAGRGAGLTRRVPVAALLDAYSAGDERTRERLMRSGGLESAKAARLLLGLERVALTRLAQGYADGLEDTIDELRRLADEASPLDADSGAMKPAEFGERLSLEVERCRRMDLPLGLVELALDAAEAERHAAVHGGALLHDVGACLRESLRRYDSVGLTAEGSFVLVLPDVSRRGLAGAAERVRRQVDACSGHAPPEMTFALAHYDVVDASAGEMLTALGRSLQEAKEGDQPPAWS